MGNRKKGVGEREEGFDLLCSIGPENHLPPPSSLVAHKILQSTLIIETEKDPGKETLTSERKREKVGEKKEKRQAEIAAILFSLLAGEGRRKKFLRFP